MYIIIVVVMSKSQFPTPQKSEQDLAPDQPQVS